MTSLITKTFLLPTLGVAFLCLSSPADANLPGSTPQSQRPQLTIPPPPKETPKQPAPSLPPKPTLPPMEKPFGMPGVIGLQNGKWEGTDYLGYLSNDIGIDIEILKTNEVSGTIEAGPLEEAARAAFEKENIVPRADVKEGPPLPFLHILVIVIPADRDKFIIMATTRLFEQVQVIRKDFVPAGYWQAITWENQDVAIATGAQIEAKTKELVEKLASAFAKRFRQYNYGREGMPPTAVR